MAPPTKVKAPQPSNRELSPKDAKAFKELLADYETKSWKKALKTAEGILTRKPDHGETLCMKGIVLQNMGKSDEGYELVKQGLRNDIESHICWHVNALMLKADRRYREALDCYIQAITRERDQPNLIRDAVTLQLYFRMFDDAVELRSRMLRLQPRLRANWLGMAVALHLAGRHEEASKTLLSYLEMQESVPKRDYETSEVVLLQAILLRARGAVDEALAWLDDHAAQVVDRPAFDRLRGDLLLSKGPSDAAATWLALFEANPEDGRNVDGYLRARAVADDPTAALAVVDELAQRRPRSTLLRTTALRLSEGEGFERRARALLHDWIVKGVPSLFVAVRSLYADLAKAQTLARIAEGFRDSLERVGTLEPPSDADASSHTIDAPTAFLWTLYYLAQHYSHLGRHADALQAIDAALAHTPVLSDLLMMRARLLKRAGDLVAAERTMTAARLLDGQDRFLNCKAVKYLLRVDQVDEAERIAGLFTRKDATSALDDLVDLQALWFIQEQGDAYRRLGKLNLALKRYHQVAKIFSDFRDDESDFHSWCQRKGTMRAYLQMLKWEDTVRAHPAFTKAAEGAVAIYLQLDARPAAPQANGVHANGTDEAEADEAARKAAKKAKKAEAKARAAGYTSSDPKKDEPVVPVDPDPNGDKLLATTAPLDEAHTFVHELETMAPGRLQTWLLSFDVALRKKQLLQALKAMRHALAIESDSPEVHVRLAELYTAVGQLPSSVANGVNVDDDQEQLRAYLRKAVADLSPVSSIDAANAELLQRHGGSPAHILAAARALLVARGSEAAPEIEGLVFQLVREETRLDHELLCSGLALLRQPPLSSARADDFREACARRMPLANAFMTPAALEQHKAGLSSTGLAAPAAGEASEAEDARETLDDV